MLAYGGYRAWQLQRWFWVTASACALLLVLFCTLVLRSGTAQQLIVFGGDGGGLVLGTLLMLTVYAREEHPIRRDHLRWGLLVIGALAFMDVYAVWSGPTNRLPFGENENGLSDPSVLTEMYGWSPITPGEPLQPARARVSHAAGGGVSCGDLLPDLQRFNQSAFCACVRRITKPSPARSAAARRATRIVRIRACPRWIAKHCATSQGLWDRPVSLLRQCRGVVCCDVRSSSNEVRRVLP